MQEIAVSAKIPMRRGQEIKKRECGECVACCVYYNIKDVNLHKEAFTPCPKLREVPAEGEYGSSTCDNCTIHDTPTMPHICTDFNCYWKLGHGDEDDRPDKSNIIIDHSKMIDNAYESKSLVEGAEDTPEGIELLERMSKSLGTPIIVLPYGELKIKRVVGKGM